MNLPAKIVVERHGVMKTSAYAYKIGRKAVQGLRLARPLAATICAWALGSVVVVVANAQARHSPAAIDCVNPYSGATWTIKIDYDQRTVDSNPANIDDATIAWRDSANGWYYVLDRKSGKLTVTVASATGGNFLHDQCKLAN